MLAESHLAVHTFPEHRSLCLNVFSCRPRDAAEGEGEVEGGVERRVRDAVGATDLDITRIERSYAEPFAPLP
jgi:S-adenosylmethionine decarboxylase